MLQNYLKIALRNLHKNRLYSLISILGLAVGITLYVFGDMLIEYEGSYDQFFSNGDRIYAIGSSLKDDSHLNFTFSAVGPVVEAELSDLEAVARSVRREFLFGTQDYSSYEGVRFVDPDFLRIFDFTYLQGSDQALNTPNGAMISQSKAIEYFGSTDVMGNTLTLDNKGDLTVTAVIADIPRNSNFNSFGMGGDTDIFVGMAALVSLGGIEPEGYWWGWYSTDVTYVLLPEPFSSEWLQTQLDNIYDRLVPATPKTEFTGFSVNPLSDINLRTWEMIAPSAVFTLSLLSLTILGIACINYCNLAVAQSMGRSREVGLRKTLGASQAQLLVQFLVESILVAAVAMITTVVVLELFIPVYNNLANATIRLNYIETLPKLVAITLGVGLVAGIYPAWLITKTQPVEALRGGVRKGKTGARVRALMIGLQFSISAFLLAMVAVTYAQSKKVEEASYIFPRSEIYTLNRLNIDEIRERLDVLQYELEALPNVESVTYSSQLPYQQSGWAHRASADRADESSVFRANEMYATPEFFDTYDIPLIAGRNLDKSIGNDVFDWSRHGIFNVLVNELTVAHMGIDSPEEAISQRFYWLDEDGEGREFVIVGVVPTQNIHSMFRKEAAWMFTYIHEGLDFASIRTNGDVTAETVRSIETVWKRIIPEFPIQGRYLDEVFNDVFSLFTLINLVVGGFALVASSLALFGLFGLAVFMAKQKTKEIGVRKVLGANTLQVTQLLIWQFSKPVIWALFFALPAAFLASNMYLAAFENRLHSPLLLILAAGILAIVLAWITIAGHAYRVARAKPVDALRHE